jgi:chromosome segregation ATPase
MTDTNEIATQVKKKNDRMFILVCFNFGMLLILFCALIYLAWESAALLHGVKTRLQEAERSVAELRSRIQSLDAEPVMDRVMQRATDRLKESIGGAIEHSELARPLTDIAAKVDDAQQRLSMTNDAIRNIGAKLQEIDTEQLARLVSYSILKGLGDGFSRAAEANKPGNPP